MVPLREIWQYWNPSVRFLLRSVDHFQSTIPPDGMHEPLDSHKKFTWDLRLTMVLLEELHLRSRSAQTTQ
jgi:hypothetical protein